mgnify:CR=1 FL=1
MERTKEEIKKVRIDFSQLKQADSIEEVLCLGILIAKHEIFIGSTIEDSRAFYNSLDSGCDSCPHVSYCLACIINE